MSESAELLLSAPIAYWPLDEFDDELAAYDQSGSYFPLTPNGTLYRSEPGPSGFARDRAFLFDGASGYLSRAPAAGDLIDNLLVGSAPYTIGAWVYFPTTVQTARGVLIARGVEATRGWGLSFSVNAANKKFNLGAYSAGAFDGTTVAVADTWYFVVGVVKTGAAASQLWVNGVQEATGTITYAQNVLADLLTVGRDSSVSQHFLGARLAHLALWNRALVAGEIVQLYQVMRTRVA